MGKIECTVEDIKEAAKFFELYQELRSRLDYAEIDSEDVEYYLDCRRKMMTSKQNEIADIMFDAMVEEMVDYNVRQVSENMKEIIKILDGSTG